MIKITLNPDRIYTRAALASEMGLPDRTMRRNIRAQRRAGIPIVPVKGGGYKIAETDAEKLQLLNLYRHRALDELVTYSRLLHSLKMEGQMSVEDLAREAVENAN